MPRAIEACARTPRIVSAAMRRLRDSSHSSSDTSAETASIAAVRLSLNSRPAATPSSAECARVAPK